MYNPEEERKRREANTKIKIEPCKYGDYEDEINVLVAHNGWQYSAISLSKAEAKKVVALLVEHFNLGKEHSDV
jgi:hypothetical protein